MTHIQHAVAAVGDRGRYQYILLGFFLLMYLELGFMLLGSTFIFMNPQFECPGAHFEHDPPSQDQVCPVFNQYNCHLINNFTITDQAGLYCQKQTSRTMIQSSIYIGSILGLIFLTPFADELGKKKMFMLSQSMCLLGLILNLIGAKTIITVFMIIGQIFIGAGSYCILIIGYVILAQLTEDKFKQTGIITLNALWALSQVFLSGFYFWFNHWLYYLIIIVIIPNIGLLIFGYFFMVESPYFLLQKKLDIVAALASMRKIATINRTDLSVLVKVESDFNTVIENVKDQIHKNKDQPKVSRFQIFKDFKYLKLLLLVAAIEIGANAYYYGVQFSLDGLGTNFGINILITGLIQFTGFFTSNFFITKIPRKKGLIGFNILCIILGLLFLIDLSTIPQTVLLGACRFFNTYAMGIIPMLQNEPFPHQYRSVAWGYIEGISQIGNFLTPYIVTGSKNLGINPLIVVSCLLGILGIVPMLFIKQTLGVTEDELVQQDRTNLVDQQSIQTSEDLQSSQQPLID